MRPPLDGWTRGPSVAPMSARTVVVPRLLRIARDATSELGEVLADHFDVTEVLVACGRDHSRSLAQRLVDDLAHRGSTVRVHDDLEGSLHCSAGLLEALDHRPASLVVGFGGGRPIDVAKLAANRSGTDFVAVPTVLSHDGICSPVASLLASDGRRRSVAAATPSGVVVDTSVVGRAPERFLRAGLGDLVSNISAVQDWRRASDEHGESFDEMAASVAAMSARAAFDIEWPPSEADIAAIARGLVMSGIAMEIAGSSRPCSGGEHLISHALDELLPDGAAMHGEQVALGTLLTCHALGLPESEHVRDLFDRVGFGFSGANALVDRATVIQAVERAPHTRPERRTVLDRVLATDDGATQLVRTALD